MSMDRISNMVSSLKNCSMAGKDILEIPYTKECEDIAKVLKSREYIEEVKTFKNEGSTFKMLSIKLAKDGDHMRLTEAKRVSKPGRRVYRGYQELKPVLGGIGVLVVSTSRGIMDSLEAKKKKLGGEVICKVY